MRLETKFVQVPNDPSAINAINNLAAAWGWTVQSIQVTDSKISYEGDSYGWINDYGAHVTTQIITEHTNYASITYQRDMDDPNYTKRCTLEAAYNACDNENFLSADEEARRDKAFEDAEREEKKYKRLAILMGVVSAYILLIASIAVKNPLPLIAGICLTVFFARKASTAHNRYPDLRNLSTLNMARRSEKKQNIVQEAQRI